MDKSALKEKRRETVIGLLKGMTIQKNAKEGFDKEDVYGCIQELCNLYEEHIEELEVNYEAEIGELTKRYQKYDENNELYISLIMEAKKSSNDIINQAKTQVEEILAAGKEQIALQEEQLEQFKADSEMQKQALMTELQTAKDVAEAEKATMRVEVEAEKEKLEAIKSKYRQQASAMEDEFAEIRTNVLRTSARLDVLKAQVEEETPEIQWDVIDAETVAIPASDVEVDDVIDVADFAENEKALEEAISSDDAFAETFFKSEILENMPAAAAGTEADAAETAATEDVEASAGEFRVYDAPEAVLPTGDVVVEAPAAEEIPTEIPVAEGPVEAEPVAGEPAAENNEQIDDDIDALLDEISFEDLLDDSLSDSDEIPADDTEIIEEISLDEVEGFEAAADENTADATAADIPEEISFESLEALFKDEK
ncbi:MAG: hypothetical protein ACI4KL_06675 [Lentihominibacter sp.]